MAGVEKAPGFFHYSAKPVRAREHRRAHRVIVGYMRQLHERNLRTRTRVRDPLSYMLRQRELEDAQRDVLYHRFFDNGSGLTSDELWMANDRANRCKDGRYKHHAGHMPRLGSFITASFPYGVSLADAIGVVDRHAEYLGSTYGVACEAVIHARNNQPDHAHFFVTDRVVDENGIGKKQRKLNGMAAKLGGDGIEVDDGYIISGPMEAIRASWASLIREIAPVGRATIDHRSFARRGLDIEPVTYVPRGEVREQEARGDDRWKRLRERELAKRPLPPVSEAEHSADETAVEPASTTLFPDLAVKPRNRRSRRPRDAEMAAMAYAARRRVELKRHDERRAGTAVEAPAAERAVEPAPASRWPDLAVRSRRRRPLEKTDADIALMAYAARRSIERRQQEERTSAGVPDGLTPRDNVGSIAQSSNVTIPEILRLSAEGAAGGTAITPTAAPTIAEQGSRQPSGDGPPPVASPQRAVASRPWSSLAMPTPMRRSKSSPGKNAAISMMAYMGRLKADALREDPVVVGTPHEIAARQSAASTTTLPPPAMASSSLAGRQKDDRRRHHEAEPPRGVLAALVLVVGGLRQATAAALLAYASRHLSSAKAPTAQKPSQKSRPGLFETWPEGRSRRARAKDRIITLALRGLAAKRHAARDAAVAQRSGPSEVLSKAPEEQNPAKPEPAPHVGFVPPNRPIASAAPRTALIGRDLTHEAGPRRNIIRRIVSDAPAFRVLEEGPIEPVITVTAATASSADTTSQPSPAIPSDDRRPLLSSAEWQLDRELELPGVGRHAQDRGKQARSDLHGDRRGYEVATGAAEAAVPASTVVLASDIRSTVAATTVDRDDVPSPKRETTDDPAVAMTRLSTRERGAHHEAPATPGDMNDPRHKSIAPTDYASSDMREDHRGPDVSLGEAEADPSEVFVYLGAPGAEGPSEADRSTGARSSPAIEEKRSSTYCQAGPPDTAGRPDRAVSASDAIDTTRQAVLAGDTAAPSDQPRSISRVRLGDPGVPKPRLLQEGYEEGLVDRPGRSPALAPPSAAKAPDGRPSAGRSMPAGSTPPMIVRHPHGDDSSVGMTVDRDGRAQSNEYASNDLAIARKPRSPGSAMSARAEGSARSAETRADRPLGSAPIPAAGIAAGSPPGHKPASQYREILVEGHEEGLLDRRPRRSVTPSKAEAGKATIGGPSDDDGVKPIGQVPTDMAIDRRLKSARFDATSAEQERPARFTARIADRTPRAAPSRAARIETTGSPPHEHSSQSQGAATARHQIDEGRTDRGPRPSSVVGEDGGAAVKPAQTTQPSSVDDRRSPKKASMDDNQPLETTENVRRQVDEPASRPSPRRAPPTELDAGRPYADEQQGLVLRYAAALRRDRQFSRSILALMVAYDPRIDMDHVERTVIELEPAAKSREIKDEVRAIATRSNEPRLMALLDAIDDLVRQARRHAQTRRTTPSTKRKGGLDPTD